MKDNKYLILILDTADSKAHIFCEGRAVAVDYRFSISEIVAPCICVNKGGACPEISEVILEVDIFSPCSMISAGQDRQP